MKRIKEKRDEKAGKAENSREKTAVWNVCAPFVPGSAVGRSAIKAAVRVGTHDAVDYSMHDANSDTKVQNNKRGSNDNISSKPSRPPSPPTQPSHTRQPPVEEDGTSSPSNCVNDVSGKQSSPPRPPQPSQVKQFSKNIRSYSFTTPSVTESKPVSHTRSRSLFNHSPKSSRASSAGSQKKKGSALQKTPVIVRHPITKHAITKSGDWDKEVYCKALYNFHGEMSCDLQFRKGQRIAIVTRTDSQDDWWEGTVNGQTGIFPANYVSL
ncbi:SH3 domain-containing YSC84-like protein 1 [Dysidea avara]|uniref:SH3 domain-containing YSC84-like protein 1 n=1 Tax=Dysidea avara TaxID=196820 RepID=UPI00331B13FA